MQMWRLPPGKIFLSIRTFRTRGEKVAAFLVSLPDGGRIYTV